MSKSFTWYKFVYSTAIKSGFSKQKKTPLKKKQSKSEENEVVTWNEFRFREITLSL